MGKVYGYMRVSSTDQSEDRQRQALLEAGVPAEGLYLDKKSGRDFERPAYKELISHLHPGDLLYIKSIDRLGRNYTEIIEQWGCITKRKGADIVVLDMPLLDTRIGKDLLGTFMADLVLQLLSFVSEHERECIRSRQKEGIAAAKARGVRFGRPPVALPPNFEECCTLWADGALNGREAAERCGMSTATFRFKARAHLNPALQ